MPSGLDGGKGIALNRGALTVAVIDERTSEMAIVKALIFGSIGTITETSDWQREAFNAAFAENGLDWCWDVDTYRAMVSGDRMAVGGDARIASYAQARGETINREMINTLHAVKTRLFQRRMEREPLPLNPGVDALLSEASEKGLHTVFASTTARASIDAMLLATTPSLGGRIDLILSGDDVAHAKPAPDIYLAVLNHLHLGAGEAIAIEDSEPSLAAALAAEIVTYAVPGQLWRAAKFRGAAGVFPSLEGVTLERLTAPPGRDVSGDAPVSA